MTALIRWQQKSTHPGIIVQKALDFDGAGAKLPLPHFCNGMKRNFTRSERLHAPGHWHLYLGTALKSSSARSL
jgi:hypothetical protein